MNNNRINFFKSFLIALFYCFNPFDALSNQDNENYIDFSSASLVQIIGASMVEEAAMEMLMEEMEKRMTFRMTVSNDLRRDDSPVIVAGTIASLQKNANPDLIADLPKNTHDLPDGFHIQYLEHVREGPTLLIAGNDPRGLLFGLGYFLRKSSFSPGKLLVPKTIAIATNPTVPLRGHQLGYRPKVNSYDGFTVEMWEQYIRDLIVFGTNAIELMPPNTDDDPHSPMFTLPQMDMMVEMTRLLEKYGLDAWIWYPLMHGDYTNDDNIQKSLAENEEVFSKLSKIDAVFVPGGDPGRHLPEVLFKQLERKAEVLHRYHPHAEIWVSPQGFSAEWMTQFFELIKKEPKWLTGIAHGPWINMDIDRFREAIPSKYPIRRYPDITHTLDAQYFMPDWDFAHAATQNREPINPRPEDQASVFHSANVDSYHGFITYSEGVNDDVNKVVWSGLGWNPDANILEILQDFSRYHLGATYAADFAQGLLNLEKNWRGSLLANSSVYTHLMMFQEMESNASPSVRLNWRFQQALYRSYYDAYTRSRLIYETQLEDQALSLLRQAPEIGAILAMNQSRTVLSKAVLDRVSTDWRQRVFELAEALFQSTRMQLSVDKYFAINIVRGANLDLIDYPLNNRFWLENQFSRITALATEQERLDEIAKIVNWENPGPGGFYDDLGDMDNQPHLVIDGDYQSDPNSYFSPFIGHSGTYSVSLERSRDWRVSQKTYMQTLYGFPLEMRYGDLDKDAQYQVKVTYVDSEEIQLITDGGILIHDYILPPEKNEPLVFDVPKEATRDGTLSLKWLIEAGGRGPGRGCSVAEVWLMKK